MAERIKVLIVDDNDDTRDGTRRLLEYEDNIEIVGFAENGQVAIEQAHELQPFVILMDINMPVMDGLQATEAIKRDSPATQIIVVSVQDDAHYMRQAFQKGAFDFVAKPITSAELAHAIERASQEYLRVKAAQAAQTTAMPPTRTGDTDRYFVQPRTIDGQVIAVMGLKGGVGKTTLAVSVGVGLARSMPDKKVLIADGNLLFGDVGVFLNTRAQYTILDVLQMASEPEGIDAQQLETVLVPHDSGAKLLLAPPNPGEAHVGPDLVAGMLNSLKQEFHYIILDTATTFDVVSAGAIRAANRLIVVTTPTMPALKDARLLFNELAGAEYSIDNVILVLNEVDRNSRITPEQIGNFLKHQVAIQIPDDPMAVEAVNQGTPLIALDPRRSVAARPLANLVSLVRESVETVRSADQIAEQPPSRKGGRFSLFGG
jgi:pilus assembly protein CpaE